MKNEFKLESNFKGLVNKWDTKMNHYRITVKYEGRQFTTDYYTGLGFMGEPRLFGVMQCLMMDYLDYEGRTYSQFVEETNYDTLAETNKVWKSMQRNYNGINRLLGDTNTDDVIAYFLD
jgi:hypothetical protein